MTLKVDTYFHDSAAKSLGPILDFKSIIIPIPIQKPIISIGYIGLANPINSQGSRLININYTKHKECLTIKSV